MYTFSLIKVTNVLLEHLELWSPDTVESVKEVSAPTDSDWQKLVYIYSISGSVPVEEHLQVS